MYKDVTEGSAPDASCFRYNRDSCYFCTSSSSSSEIKNHGGTSDLSASLEHHIPCQSWVLPGYKHFLETRKRNALLCCYSLSKEMAALWVTMKGAAMQCPELISWTPKHGKMTWEHARELTALSVPKTDQLSMVGRKAECNASLSRAVWTLQERPTLRAAQILSLKYLCPNQMVGDRPMPLSLNAQIHILYIAKGF